MKLKMSPLDIYLSTILLLILWLLYALNLWNGDRDGYEIYYQRESIRLWGPEILYGYINIALNKSGLPFQIFQSLIAFLTLLLMTAYLKKVSSSLFLSLIIYAIFMFPLDYVLMRNSLAFAVVLNALILLYYNKKNLYFFVIVVASLIHISAAFFLIFLLTKNYRIKIFPTLIISIMIIVIFNILFDPYFLGQRIADHLNFYPTNWRTITSAITPHLLSTILIYFYVSNKKTISKYDIIISNINVISILLMFLYFEAPIFIRVFRLIVFINLIYILQLGMKYENSFLKKKSTIIGMMYILLYLPYLYFSFIHPYRETSLYSLFKYNIFINQF